MQLKIQNVMDATLLISQIMREQRPMPQVGKYRMMRLHAKLLPEFVTINASRDAMIKDYGFRQTVTDADGNTKETGEWAVPTDKVDEFNAAWLAIAGEEITIDVDPLVMSDINMGALENGSIEASELFVLGDLFVG